MSKRSPSRRFCSRPRSRLQTSLGLKPAPPATALLGIVFGVMAGAATMLFGVIQLTNPHSIRGFISNAEGRGGQQSSLFDLGAPPGPGLPRSSGRPPLKRFIAGAAPDDRPHGVWPGLAR